MLQILKIIKNCQLNQRELINDKFTIFFENDKCSNFKKYFHNLGIGLFQLKNIQL